MKKFISILLITYPLLIFCQKNPAIDTTNKFVEIKYDKFYDIYSYEQKEWNLLLNHETENGWQFNLVFGIDAYKNGITKKIQFEPYFLGRNRRLRYEDWDEILLLVDGKRLKLDIIKHEIDSLGENYFLEKLLIKLKNKDLISIANAKKVEGRIGIDEFNWNYHEREALREMIKLVYEK